MRERREDPGLWSVAGYVQLMLGHIPAADRTFHKAAELYSRAPSPDQQRKAQAIARRHQGLLLFARNDFAGQISINHVPAGDIQQPKSLSMHVSQEGLDCELRSNC